jgi:hypothetical protein
MKKVRIILILLPVKGKLFHFGNGKGIVTPRSEGTIQRLWHQHGRVRLRKLKPKTKKDLREVKRRRRPFMGLGLLRNPHTVRKVVSGLVFTGYADKLSKTYFCLLAEQVFVHLALHGVAPEEASGQPIT